MYTYEEEKQKNLEAYATLKDEFRTRYRGQYVAIGDGRLIKVSPSFEEADEAVKGYRHCLVFPAGEAPIIGPLRVRTPQFGASLTDFIRVRQNDQNEYRLQIRVEGHLIDALIDTGLTNPDSLVGAGLNRESYRAVRPYLRHFQRIAMEGTGSDAPDRVLGGLGRVSIEGLDGSEVETYVAEVGDNLLGVCYFHRLPGYEIVWDLEAGEMTIRKKVR